MKNSVGLKPENLLPTNSHTDRPLFFVMMIMVFLACLAAIAAHASYRAAGNWSQDLEQSATVQIKAGLDQDSSALTQQVVDILNASPSVDKATALSKERAGALLRPWLGDIDLPETLPVPYLVDVSLKSKQMLDEPALQSEFARLGINAEIDNHGRWRRDISRTSRAAQLIAITALALLIAAATSTAAFATQAGLSTRRTVIDVLTQVGAHDQYIAGLFTSRFAWLGLKAGIAGALLAGILAVIFWLLSGGASSALVPGFAIDTFDLLMLCFAPVIAALICALAARYTVLATLRKEAL